MTHFLRFFIGVIFVVSSTRLLASDEVEQFAKRCDLFHGQKGFYEDIKGHLKKQATTLRRAVVPIRLSFDTCKLEYIVRLKNGGAAEVEHSYSTNAEPDNKGVTHFWNPKSPSPHYWYFESGGWEWGGFALVHKVTGRIIKETSECGYNRIQIRGNLLAVICVGNYENTAPTLYIVDLNKQTPRWSQAIPLPGCEDQAHFFQKQFVFTSPTDLRVGGVCVFKRITGSSKPANTKAANYPDVVKIERTPVKTFTVKYQADGLTIHTTHSKTAVGWDDLALQAQRSD